MNITDKELLEAIEYIDKLEKGVADMKLDATTNGGGSENITELKSEMVGLIKKAKQLKEKIDSLEKSDDEEPMEEPVEDTEDDIEKSEGEVSEVEEPKKTEKPQKTEKEPNMDKEEIIKSIRDELTESLKQELDTTHIVKSLKDEISNLNEKIRNIENTPIRKSLTSTPLEFKDRFEKAQSEGKQIVSKTTHKTKISNSLFDMFEKADDLEKGALGEAVSQFESAGYLSPEIKDRLSKGYNLEII